MGFLLHWLGKGRVGTEIERDLLAKAVIAEYVSQ